LRRSNGNGGGQEATAAVWAAITGLSIGEAWLRRDEPKAPEVVARYQDAVSQLDRGVPFAYAVGSVGFRTLDLKIDPRALIPRPETEGLVELVLARCASGLIADIGTGCGCIALALAVEGQFERVIAVEQSAAAAALVWGAVAGGSYGSAYGTFDVDIAYARDDDNLERLAGALTTLGATLRGAPPDLPFQLDAKTLANGANFTFTTRLGSLDILGDPAGAPPYRDLKAAGTTITVSGMEVTVASIDHLIAMKEAAGTAAPSGFR